MKPTVGRIVHYVAFGTPGGEYPAGACRAAIVSETYGSGAEPQPVGLVVLNPTGLFFNRSILHDEGDPGGGLRPIYKPGTWHWPEREPES